MLFDETYNQVRKEQSITRLPFTVNNVLLVSRTVDPDAVVTVDGNRIQIKTSNASPFVTALRGKIVDRMKIIYKENVLDITKE